MTLDISILLEKLTKNDSNDIRSYLLYGTRIRTISSSRSEDPPPLPKDVSAIPAKLELPLLLFALLIL